LEKINLLLAFFYSFNSLTEVDHDHDPWLPWREINVSNIDDAATCPPGAQFPPNVS